MEILRKSMFRTACDECRQQFPINSGGVCEQCRRILCNRHLHGSFVRRIRIALGAPYQCVACRSGRTPETR